MRHRKPLMAAMLGGTCTMLLLAAPASGQRPATKQQSQTPALAASPAATQTLRLPADQTVVELTVQAPSEVHVGRSFEYRIHVQNSSKDIAVHDLVISQLAGKDFDIESVEIQGVPSSAQQDKGAGKQPQNATDKPEQSKENAQSDGPDSKPSKSDKETSDEEEQSGKQRQSQSDETQSKSSEAGESKSKSSQSTSQSNSSDGETKAKPAQSSGANSKADKRANKTQPGTSAGSRWTIDRLMPGESRTIVVTASSDSEGAGNACVAIESYTPALCLATRFTKPELEIVKQAPEVAVICDEITFDYLVRNTGSGDLQRFTVRDKLPKGLQTVDGAESLEFTLDDGLKSGETRKFAARLRATSAGDFTSRATVEGSGGIKARSNLAGTKVQKADLALAIEGPGTQELGGLANYTVRVTNRGDATAPGTQLRVYFPRSADLVRAGEPRRSSRAVEGSVAHAPGSGNEQASHPHRSQTGDQQSTDEEKKADGEKKTDGKKKADAAEQTAESQQHPNEKQPDDQKSKQDDDRQKSDADRQSQSPKKQQASGDARDQARREQNRENRQRGNMAQHLWQLGSLAPGQTVEVTYALRPYEGGQLDQAAVAEYVCATTQDREMLRAETETSTEILMLPGLRLTAVDDHDPVRAGENVTYTIAVLNQGDAPAHNVNVHAKLPKQVKFVEAKGATSGQNSDGGVSFEPVKTLKPGERVVWQLVGSVNTGVGESAQDSIAVTLDSDDLQETITSEEPTTFFEVEQRTARSTDAETKATQKKK